MRRRRKPSAQASPRLRAALFETVQNQLDANDPPETRETFQRLLAQGIGEEDAKIYIAQAVTMEVWHILKEKKPFNCERYVKYLKRLPQPPWEQDEEGDPTAEERV